MHLFSKVFLTGLVTVIASFEPSYDHVNDGNKHMFREADLDGIYIGETMTRAESEDGDGLMTGSIPSTPVISSCAAFIDYFGEVTANFTNCIVSFSRPLRVCGNCVEQYLLANSAFNFVMSGGHKDEKREDCGKLILTSDRIQIIVRTYHFIRGIWDDCNCNNCFDISNGENGTVNYRPSNDTLTFQELAKEAAECFQENADHVKHDEKRNVSYVCINCSDIYQEINDFYDHIIETSHQHVCMDIVDTINSTRQEWSKHYGCSLKDIDATPVFIISGVFSLMPIVFYLGNCLYVKHQQNEGNKNKPTEPSIIEDTDVNDSS